MISQEYEKLLAEAGYTGSLSLNTLFAFSGAKTLFIRDDKTYGCAGGTPFVGFVDGYTNPEDAVAEYILRCKMIGEEGILTEGKKRPKKKAKKKYQTEEYDSSN